MFTQNLSKLIIILLSSPLNLSAAVKRIDDQKLIDARNLERMFVRNHIVPGIIAEVPPNILNVTLAHMGRSISMVDLEERKAADIEETMVAYSLVKNEYHTVFCFFVYAINKQYLDIMKINMTPSQKEGYMVTGGDNDYTCLDCKYLQAKRPMQHVCIYGLQVLGMIRDIENISKFDQSNKEFVAKEFLEDNKIYVTRGAAMRIICDDRSIKNFNWFFVPVVAFLALVGLISCLVILFEDFGSKHATD